MALKYYFEYYDVSEVLHRVEFHVEGFVGTATELQGGGTPFVETKNKDAAEQYLGGIVTTSYAVQVVTTPTFNSESLTSENYGDVTVIKKTAGTIVAEGVVAPFRSRDVDLPSGLSVTQIEAEDGLVFLRGETYPNTTNRLRIIDVLHKCLQVIPTVTNFEYQVIDNTKVATEATGTNNALYWNSYINDEFFFERNCYDVINILLLGLCELSLSDGVWLVRNINEINEGNTLINYYDNTGTYVSSSSYNRPTNSDILRLNGDFGRNFSFKNVTITKEQTKSKQLLTGSELDDVTGWTAYGSIATLLTFDNGLLKNNENTVFEPSGVDSDYYENTTGISYYPYQPLTNDTLQALKVSLKINTNGNNIKNLRLQIIAKRVSNSTNYYLTTEGNWYRVSAGSVAPIYKAEPKGELTIELPTPPYENDLTDLGNAFEGLNGILGSITTGIPSAEYQLFIRIYQPERANNNTSGTLTERSWLDYIRVSIQNVNNEFADGFIKSYGIETYADRTNKLTIPVEIGYNLAPYGLETLYLTNVSTAGISHFSKFYGGSYFFWKDVRLHVANEYLKALSVRRRMYNGTLFGATSFGQLFSVDGTLMRVHNYSYNSRINQSNVTLIEVSENIESAAIEKPLFTKTEAVEIQRALDERLNSGKYDRLNIYSENFTATVRDGKALLVETTTPRYDNVMMRTGEVFLVADTTDGQTDGIKWTDNDGIVTDYIIKDTDGFLFKSQGNPYTALLDFTLLTQDVTIKMPDIAANAVIATDITAWMLGGNTLGAKKLLGSLDAFDVGIIRNGVEVATVKDGVLEAVSNATGSIKFDTTAVYANEEGRLTWNSVDGTLDLGLKGGNVRMQIGQEEVVRVVNKTGANLLESEFRCVRIRRVDEGGAQGQRLAVVLSKADSNENSGTTLALVTENIDNNQEGFVITFGNVSDIDTTGAKSFGGTETWVDGDALYLSATNAGYLTKVKPTSPHLAIQVGWVVYAHANNGKIFVRIDAGSDLDRLHDVILTSPANNNLLSYNSSLGVWQNKTIASAIGSALTTNYVTKWNGTNFANSLIFDNGTNVGIGTTSPAYKLDVNGFIRFGLGNPFVAETNVLKSSGVGQNGALIRSAVSSATLPTYSNADDSDTGIFFASADVLGVSTNAIERMRFHSDGNISIGSLTNNGVDRLQVSGTISATGIKGYSSNLLSIDNRTISPNTLTTSRVNVGFGSYNNNNTFPYADYLHFNSYSDSTGGEQNLIMFKKSGRGMRIYQGTFQNASAYSNYADVLISESSTSISQNYILKQGTSGIVNSQIFDNGTNVGIGTTSPAYRLDVTGTGRFTGAVQFDTVPSSLQDATSANHLVRYSQWIATTSVKYLPTAVKTVALANITLSGEQTISGYAAVTGDRVLVTAQTTASQNGIYVVSAGAWTRATDSDTDTELRGFIVNVNAGTYAGYKYINTNQSAITVGTTSITYAEFSNLVEIDPIFTAWRDTSRTANTVYAAPNGSAGTATFRALVAADIPNLDWSKITTGLPTTLSGYGITDAYTQTQIDGFLATKSNTGHTHTAGDITNFVATVRTSINFTTVGSSGASTYNSTTGELNVPNYTLAGLGGEPAFTKNTAFNKDFGTTAGTVSEGNHVHTFASLTSKPTTIAGYGITDAYTESEVDTLLATKSNTNHTHDASAIVSGTINTARLSGIYSVNTTGYATTLIADDNRIIIPNELSNQRVSFGFTTWNNNNSTPYADYLHFNAWTDASGGNQNLIVLNKSSIGIRIYQASYQSSSAYSTYKDVSFDGHTHTFAELTSKPTTIAGYGITDAYTKTQIDTFLSGKSNVDHTHTTADITNFTTAVNTLQDDYFFDFFRREYLDGLGGSRIEYGLWFYSDGEVNGRLTVDNNTGLVGFKTKHINESSQLVEYQTVLDDAGRWVRFDADGNGREYAFKDEIQEGGGGTVPSLQEVTDIGLRTNKRIVFEEASNTFYAFATVSDTVRLSYRHQGGTAVQYALLSDIPEAGTIPNLQQVSNAGADSTVRLQFNGVNYATATDLAALATPTLQQVSAAGSNSTIRLQFNGVNYATVTDISNAYTLDQVVGNGSIAVDKNISIANTSVGIDAYGFILIGSSQVAGGLVWQNLSSILQLSSVNTLQIVSDVRTTIGGYTNSSHLINIHGRDYNLHIASTPTIGDRYAFEWDGSKFVPVKIN